MKPTAEYQVARAAARAGGEILMQYFRQSFQVDYKSTWNLVSEADLHSEKTICETIRETFPNHVIMAEESTHEVNSNGHLWIVDPLDGTNNFCHGIGHFAVSIAYYRHGKAELGVIYQPFSREWYLAGRGQGAWHDERRCRATQTGDLSDALIGTGFFYDRGAMMQQTLVAIKKLFQQNIRGIRRMGTASLDLCLVGAGAFGGFFEFELAPWDFAAGQLFVEEAGGRVTDCLGRPLGLSNSSVLAAGPDLHSVLLNCIRPAFNQANPH